VLGLLLIAFDIGRTWMSGGFPAVLELMSPLNVSTYVTMFITLAPAVLALSWSDRLRARRLRTRRERRVLTMRSRA
jgi:hypothetical protein